MGQSESQRVPIGRGLLCGDVDDLATVRLAGTRCAACGEASLGSKTFCSNCGSPDVRPIELGREGTLWSYTVVRHRPPGNYRAPDPFEPFGVGLVELPEEIRVFSPLSGPVEELEIGSAMTFIPEVRQEQDGPDVVVFSFGAADGAVSQ